MNKFLQVISILFLCSFGLYNCRSLQKKAPADFQLTYRISPPHWDTDSIILFANIEIENPIIYEVLDSIIKINTYSAHSQNEELIWFYITDELHNDTIKVRVCSEQYDGVFLCKYTNQVSDGAFYYKGFLFIRSNLSDSPFFKKSIDSIPVQYYYSHKKLYYYEKKGARYCKQEIDPAITIVQGTFVSGKLMQLDYRTTYPPKIWTIIPN